MVKTECIIEKRNYGLDLDGLAFEIHNQENSERIRIVETSDDYPRISLEKDGDIHFIDVKDDIILSELLDTLIQYSRAIEIRNNLHKKKL